MAKPIRALEFHYPIIQFLIMTVIVFNLHTSVLVLEIKFPAHALLPLLVRKLLSTSLPLAEDKKLKAAQEISENFEVCKPL